MALIIRQSLSRVSYAALLLATFLVSLINCVSSTPSTAFGVYIPHATGVALSADGSRCFVTATTTGLTNGPLLYVVPLPFNASAQTTTPAPYWAAPGPSRAQFYYMAASASSSPQLLYFVNQPSGQDDVQLLSLAVTSPAPVNTTVVYDFGSPGTGAVSGYGVSGMYYQAASNLLYFACQQGISGSLFDFVGVLNPSAASPTLRQLYVSSYQSSMFALAVSSTHLYFSAVFTTGLDGVSVFAQLVAVPLTNASFVSSSTPTQVLYTTINITAFGPKNPMAMLLNANESILYINDMGDLGAQFGFPGVIYSLYPLSGSSTLPTLSTVYASSTATLEPSFALAPDQSTLYFAAATQRNGVYVTSNANSSSIVPATVPVSSSSAVPYSTSASSISIPSSTGFAFGSNTTFIPVGIVVPVLSFVFSNGPGSDDMACLTSDSSQTVGLAASRGGDIFVWSLQGQPATVSPSYSADHPFTGALIFLNCQANPQGTQLYLLDSRGKLLYRYTPATPTLPPVVIASFSDELPGSLNALAIDFSAQVAYVGTIETDNVYTVNITRTGQSLTSFDAIPFNSDVVSLALSADGRQLYYGSPAPTQGVPGAVYSVPVLAGTIPDSSSPKVIFRSTTLAWPDSLLIHGSSLYVKDGGGNHAAVAVVAPFYLNTLSVVTIGSTVTTTATTLYSTLSTSLPAGLLLSTDASQLMFTTATAILTLEVAAAPAPTATLCFLTYSLPGSIDYPWSLATEVQVAYFPTPVFTSAGRAASLISATGTRTYTNRFGQTTTIPVTLATAALTGSSNLVYVNASTLVDAKGVMWNLTQAVQLPGLGPYSATSLVQLHNVSGAVVEGNATQVDGIAQAWLSTLPGFVNRTIGAANYNSLVADYANCRAPITYTNGLRSPVEPGASNTFAVTVYSYTVSDGVSYSVQTNVSLTVPSTFIISYDQLGNPYKPISGATGTRQYTYLRTGATLLSNITGLSTNISALADQRFYPYALLSASPSVYTTNSAPYLDFDGLEFSVSPAVPANGAAPGTGPQYAAVRVWTTPAGLLTESNSATAPVAALQRQSQVMGN